MTTWWLDSKEVATSDEENEYLRSPRVSLPDLPDLPNHPDLPGAVNIDNTLDSLLAELQ